MRRVPTVPWIDRRTAHNTSSTSSRTDTSCRTATRQACRVWARVRWPEEYCRWELFRSKIRSVCKSRRKRRCMYVCVRVGKLINSCRDSVCLRYLTHHLLGAEWAVKRGRMFIEEHRLVRHCDYCNWGLCTGLSGSEACENSRLLISQCSLADQFCTPLFGMKNSSIHSTSVPR